MKLKCLIVDDEPIARKVLREYIEDVPFLELEGEASNPVRASEMLDNKKIDLIFLDVQMPLMNGIEFLKASVNLPMIIITSAFSDYALQGYELDVLDYLVKPISFERFMKACNKAKSVKTGSHSRDTEEYFFIRYENRYEKILFDELLFIEAAGNYVYIQTKEKKLITYLTFKGIEGELPLDKFIKVHKSYIVSLNKIDNISAEELSIGKHSIPLSRSYKEEVMARVLNNRLIRR